MKENERLFEQLGEVNEEFIVEAAPKARIRRSGIKWAAMAVAGAAAAGVLVWQTGALEKNTKKPDEGKTSHVMEFPDDGSEPEKIVSSGEIDHGGAGSYTLMANDISQIIGNNPTREGSSFTKLPVFNGVINEFGEFDKDGDGKIDEGSEEKYKELRMDELNRAASFFTDKEVWINRDDDFGIEGAAGDVRVSLYGYGNLNIDFGTPIELPDEYKIRTMNNGKTIEESEKSVQYICDKYKDLLRFDSPEASIVENYDIYNNCNTGFYAYDKSDDPLTALINYNFNSADFRTDEKQIVDDPDALENPYDGFEYSGDLAHIGTSSRLDYLEFVGNYPIISYDEAYEKLINDPEAYIWPENLPDGLKKDEIFYAGIKYERTADYKYRLPYYMFYVEVHPEREGIYKLPEGRKEYEPAYILAVKKDYMEFPDTEVAFN